MTAVDGTTRCLPGSTGVWASVYYGNTECTQPVGYGTAYVAAPKYALEGLTTEQGYQYRVWPVSTRYTGSKIYMKSGENCAEYPISTTIFWTLGTEVPPSTFVRFDVVIQGMP
jgi:hypothetical protein